MQVSARTHRVTLYRREVSLRPTAGGIGRQWGIKLNLNKINGTDLVFVCVVWSCVFFNVLLTITMQGRDKLCAKLTSAFLRKWCKYLLVYNIYFIIDLCILFFYLVSREINFGNEKKQVVNSNLILLVFKIFKNFSK